MQQKKTNLSDCKEGWWVDKLAGFVNTKTFWMRCYCFKTPFTPLVYAGIILFKSGVWTGWPSFQYMNFYLWDPPVVCCYGTLGLKKALIYCICWFPWCNYSHMANSRLLLWYHWWHSWEEMPMTGLHEPARAGSLTLLTPLLVRDFGAMYSGKLPTPLPSCPELGQITENLSPPGRKSQRRTEADCFESLGCSCWNWCSWNLRCSSLCPQSPADTGSLEQAACGAHQGWPSPERPVCCLPEGWEGGSGFYVPASWIFLCVWKAPEF